MKIPKKGDLSNCKNWRGINLLCVASKVFCKIILTRMMEVLEKGIRWEQAGFRLGRSCVDQINTLRMIIEQSVEMNARVYMLFVDYRVAFDSLKRECIWRSLRNRGLPGKIVNIIEELYNGFECCVTQWAVNGSLYNSVRSEAGMLVVGDLFPDSAGWGFETVFRWKKERDPVESYRTS